MAEKLIDVSKESFSVLIAEDELIIAMYLSKWLAKHGVKVVDVCTSGQKAILAAEKFKPDILILDFNLADSINGIDVAQKVNAVRKTPILFLSAMKEKRFTDKNIVDAPFIVMSKPFSNANVLEALNDLSLM